jgi:hypothetical protein
MGASVAPVPAENRADRDASVHGALSGLRVADRKAAIATEKILASRLPIMIIAPGTTLFAGRSLTHTAGTSIIALIGHGHENGSPKSC